MTTHETEKTMQDDPTALTNNDLRLALDKAAKKTSVAVLPLSSGLAKTHHLDALRLILDELPSENWRAVSEIEILSPGDVYLVTGPGWECVSTLSDAATLETTVAYSPLTGRPLTFGYVLHEANDYQLYVLEQE